MALNWNEVNKSVKEGERQRSGGARRLYIKDGESVDIRLIGGEDEPFIYKRHYDAKTGRYIPCAEDEAKAGRHQGCVACMVARAVRGEGKTARLKSPQRVYVVSVFDPRKFHYVESKPKGEQYQPCADDDSCRYCRKGLERKINGVRYWEMAENLITQLRQFEVSTLGKRCARCQTGRVKVAKYICPTCEEELEPDDPTQEVRCVSCEKESGKKLVEVKAKEVVHCAKCGPKGRRISLEHAWITVSVSGQRASKTWNFNVGEVEEFDADAFLKEFPDLKKIAPLHLSEMPDFQPASAAEQAAILGVPNPFGKGSKKAADDDDDDDPPRRKKRPVDDDDDDDDAPPPKKKKKGLFDESFEEDDAPKKGKKPAADDDDEDEEDIF